MCSYSTSYTEMNKAVDALTRARQHRDQLKLELDKLKIEIEIEPKRGGPQGEQDKKEDGGVDDSLPTATTVCSVPTVPASSRFEYQGDTGLCAPRTVLLASQSAIKLTACLDARGALGKLNLRVAPTSVPPCARPEQPIGVSCAWVCALDRIRHVRTLDKSSPILAVENYITHGGDQDRALVVLDYPLRRFFCVSEPASIPAKYRRHTPFDFDCSVTVGKRIAADFPHIPHDDWFHHFPENYMTRTRQIRDAVHRVIVEQQDALDSHQLALRSFDDYPQPNVCFQDLWSIWGTRPDIAGAVVAALCNQVLAARVPGRIVLVGLEMRGVMLAALMAARLDVPFVPARKKGAKLPGHVIESGASSTEYGGGDRFVLQTEYLGDAEYAIVVDDIVATGGSVAAVCDMIATQTKLKIGLVTCVSDVRALRAQWLERLAKWRVALVWD